MASGSCKLDPCPTFPAQWDDLNGQPRTFSRITREHFRQTVLAAHCSLLTTTTTKTPELAPTATWHMAHSDSVFASYTPL